MQANGQAFILHVYDSQNGYKVSEDGDWHPTWVLLNYITHCVGVCKSFLGKTNFYARIDEM